MILEFLQIWYTMLCIYSVHFGFFIFLDNPKEENDITFISYKHDVLFYSANHLLHSYWYVCDMLIVFWKNVFLFFN